MFRSWRVRVYSEEWVNRCYRRFEDSDCFYGIISYFWKAQSDIHNDYPRQLDNYLVLNTHKVDVFRVQWGLVFRLLWLIPRRAVLHWHNHSLEHSDLLVRAADHRSQSNRQSLPQGLVLARPYRLPAFFVV